MEGDTRSVASGPPHPVEGPVAMGVRLDCAGTAAVVTWPPLRNPTPRRPRGEHQPAEMNKKHSSLELRNRIFFSTFVTLRQRYGKMPRFYKLSRGGLGPT